MPVEKTGAKRVDDGTVGGARTGQVNRRIVHHARRRLRQEQDPVAQVDRLVQVVGHEQHGRRLGLPEVKEDLAQPVADRLVERDERLVKQQDRRADGKSARASATRRRCPPERRVG